MILAYGSTHLPMEAILVETHIIEKFDTFLHERSLKFEAIVKRSLKFEAIVKRSLKFEAIVIGGAALKLLGIIKREKLLIVIFLILKFLLK